MLLDARLFRRLSVIIVAVVLHGALSTAAMAQKSFTLDTIQTDIVRDYDGVAHMPANVLAAQLKSNKNVVLFDVREASEYSVSRIPGAERVDPSIWHRQFINRFSRKTKGKTVIFYCSVGVRSSKLARYVQKELLKNGAKAVYNLKGGLFEWHNDKRQLANKNGSTDYVHPYNKHWGQLVKRQNMTRYKPGR